MTFGTIESCKASAGAIVVVADAASGAVATSLVAVAVQWVCASGTLLQVTGWTSIAFITEATDFLHSIPGGSIRSLCLGREDFLRPAGAAVVAVVWTDGSLAGNAFVASETVAGTRRTIADTLVGTFYPRVSVVSIDDFADPGVVLGTGAQRAVGARPLWLSIQTSVALAVIVIFTSSMTRTLVLAKTAHTEAALVEDSGSPGFRLVRRRTGRI